MHLGVDGILKHAQKCVYMPGLRTAIAKQLASCQGCMQKYKVQKDVRVEHCFYTRERGYTSQVVHLDLAGPMPETKEGYKFILGLADHFSSFVMAIAIKGKMH